MSQNLELPCLLPVDIWLNALQQLWRTTWRSANVASTRSWPFGALENCCDGQTGRVIVGVTGPMERRTGSCASDVI